MNRPRRDRNRLGQYRVVRRDDKRWTWEYVQGLKVRYQGPQVGFTSRVAAENDLAELFDGALIQDSLPGLE